MTTHTAPPLAGIKVLEMGQLIAGPFAAKTLADFGADVVKIEPPGAGDPMRTWGNGTHKVWWEVIGRNKRSLALDLRTPEGREALRKMVADLKAGQAARREKGETIGGESYTSHGKACAAAERVLRGSPVGIRRIGFEKKKGA